MTKTSALNQLLARLEPLQQQLDKHELYKSIQDLDDLNYFMQNHVFAVWDFMSLLKYLQRSLTCIDIPWTPQGFRESRRLINEIVLGEESDNINGRNISHLELYIESMTSARSDPSCFLQVMKQLSENAGELSDDVIHQTFRKANAPLPAEKFVRTTFEFIRTNKLHVVTSAFTFGREDLIPLMFSGMLRDMNKGMAGALDPFIVYLERHIEVDGDEHGPMALKMVSEVCGEDELKWKEAMETAEKSLKARISLWDGVVEELKKRHNK